MLKSERRDQRNAVLAGFLGWTLDAFDFFILTLVIDDVANAFGKTRPQIALAITLTLAMRPVGAVVFGLMADRYGRRIPLMLNVIFYAVISVLCGLAPSYAVFIFLVLLMAMMNFMSHGTQDMYPTLLATFGYSKARIADVTMISMIGAVLGGLVFGYYSDRSGRRRAMITAAACALLMLPFWIAGIS